MINDSVKERLFVLTVQQWAVDTMMELDPVLGQAKMEMMKQFCIEPMVHQLRLSLKAPALVLQLDKVIATYPTSLWDYIKRAVRLPHKLTQVRLTEHLLFPTVQIPEFEGRTRVGTQVAIRSVHVPPLPETDYED